MEGCDESFKGHMNIIKGVVLLFQEDWGCEHLGAKGFIICWFQYPNVVLEANNEEQCKICHDYSSQGEILDLALDIFGYFLGDCT